MPVFREPVVTVAAGRPFVVANDLVADLVDLIGGFDPVGATILAFVNRFIPDGASYFFWDFIFRGFDDFWIFGFTLTGTAAFPFVSLWHCFIS